MALDDTSLDHLADLARLELADEERDELRVELERLLGYLAQLQSVDVSGVVPMSRPFDSDDGAHHRRGPPGCRSDAVTSERTLAVEWLERLAPAWMGERFRVARTVDESG